MKIKLLDIINENLVTDNELHLISLLDMKPSMKVDMIYVNWIDKSDTPTDDYRVKKWKSHKYIIKNNQPPPHVYGWLKTDLDNP